MKSKKSGNALLAPPPNDFELHGPVSTYVNIYTHVFICILTQNLSTHGAKSIFATYYMIAIATSHQTFSIFMELTSHRHFLFCSYSLIVGVIPNKHGLESWIV